MIDRVAEKTLHLFKIDTNLTFRSSDLAIFDVMPLNDGIKL